MQKLSARGSHHSKEYKARETEVLNCSDYFGETSEMRPHLHGPPKFLGFENKHDAQPNFLSSRKSFNLENNPVSHRKDILSSNRSLQECEPIPEEFLDYTPPPSSKMQNSKIVTSSLGFLNSTKFRVSPKNDSFSTGTENLDGSSNQKISSFQDNLPILEQTPVVSDGYNFYKYISQRTYSTDQEWTTRDSFFQIMLNSMKNGEEGVNWLGRNSPTQLSISPSKRNFFSYFYTPKVDRVLLLDLDETLIRSEPYLEGTATRNPIISVNVNETEIEHYEVYVRPYLKVFLEAMSQQFHVAVYTAGISNYAQRIVDVIDPERRYIQQIFSREHCLDTETIFIKDLNFGTSEGASLDNVILVDNYVHSFALHLSQGVPIKPFYGDSQDRELLHLSDLLSQAAYSSLKEFLQSHCNFSEFFRFLKQHEPYFSVD